jgi:hypothetical protein
MFEICFLSFSEQRGNWKPTQKILKQHAIINAGGPILIET